MPAPGQPLAHLPQTGPHVQRRTSVGGQLTGQDMLEHRQANRATRRAVQAGGELVGQAVEDPIALGGIIGRLLVLRSAH